MPPTLSIRAILLSSFAGIVPVAFLTAFAFIWQLLIGGSSLKAWFFGFAAVTIIGAPFIAGYMAARISARLQYIHGLASVIIIFIASRILGNFLVSVVSSLLFFLVMLLPDSLQKFASESLMGGYFDGTILLFVSLCVFGAVGVFASLKTSKINQSKA
jgi:hypothetical protein